VVAAYIGGAFWYTATDFANPAVTLARTRTVTFSGIRPSDVPGFFVAEIAEAIAAVIMFGGLLPNAVTAVGEAAVSSLNPTNGSPEF
jgi:hypothetical protein